MNKISAVRKTDSSRSRRKKPLVNIQKRALKRRIENENAWIADILKEAEISRYWLEDANPPYPGYRVANHPFVVFTEIDHPYHVTDDHHSGIPKWKHTSESWKITLGWMFGREVGAHSFTSRIIESVPAKAVSSGQLDAVHVTLQRRLRKRLEQRGIANVEYCYVLEARTRHGRSRTDIHAHGYVVPTSPHDLTLFKQALENAWLGGVQRRKPNAAKAIVIERGYDLAPDLGLGTDRKNGGLPGRARWASYMIKNVHRYDLRMRGRRVYMSQSLTRAVREGHALLRREPVPPTP